ncbi:hypothetical protein [Streptomyces albidoflavus]|uniref:hypothetical protein n=1 Tax=Streptomyces albidoflavus TaxID=1886 RepID=UPI0033DA3771
MTLYRRRGDGLLMIAVRTEHRVSLRELTMALYHSNEELGRDLPVRTVRAAVSNELAYGGSNLLTKIADYITEAREHDGGSAVGSEVHARLEWARRMVVKAYGGEYEGHPEVLAALRAFESLPVEELV